MANVKITEYTAIDALVAADLFEVVDDPAGTPTSKKATAAQIVDYALGKTGIIATTYYNPGTDANPSTTSSSYADVDATNAKIAFTVPSTGNVLITANVVVELGASTVMGLGLRLGTDNVTGSGQVASQLQGIARHRCEWYLTGLTPAASVTYKLSFARLSGAADCKLRYGSNGATSAGALIMTCHAL